MRFFKKLTSAILSLLIANPFVSNITKANGNRGDYIDIPDVCEENSINLDMTVIQTPGTDAEKFLKRFFDKDAPYYEKDKQTNETTSVINLFEEKEFEKFSYTSLKIVPDSEWKIYPNYRNHSFYTENADGTYTFKFKHKTKNELLKDIMNEYNIKIRKIVVNNIDELNSYSDQISKSPIIFELFDCRNSEKFFSLESAKKFMDQINIIDSAHYNVVVFDNYKEELLNGELDVFRLDIRSEENSAPMVFNSSDGRDIIAAYHYIFSPLAALYFKKTTPSNTCNLEKAILYGGLGFAGLTATFGVGYGIYKGVKKFINKKPAVKTKSLEKVKNLV